MQALPPPAPTDAPDPIQTPMVHAREQQEQQQRPEPQDSLLRRIFVATGLLPAALTPEQEQLALEQLTELFPQYKTADLLQSLRQRGSAQGVAEAVLLGLFVGTPRNATADMMMED